MAELDRSESGTRSARHIVRRQVAKAIEALEGHAPSDEVVHDARKELKRARATLRLLRGAIGDRAYRRENEALRDAARPLGVIRDSKVLLDTLNGLIEHFQASDEPPPTEGLRRTLRRQRVAARRTALAGPRPFSESCTTLRAVL